MSLRNASNSFNPVNSSTISQQFRVHLKPGQTFTAIKYVGIASSDAFDDPFVRAMSASQRAVRVGWDSLLAEHNQAWETIWDSASITVPGNEELQLAVTASIFHLVANVRSGSEGRGLGDNSISVSGLSSDSYAGMIFWDADTWMYPGLFALHPNFGASIVNYRQKLHNQAIRNVATYNVTTNISQNLTGAVYPWTSARFGNCTATGPCFNYVSLESWTLSVDYLN
jgi:trehalose/maltose hydrolase-like predicted phosphorylase